MMKKRFFLSLIVTAFLAAACAPAASTTAPGMAESNPAIPTASPTSVNATQASAISTQALTPSPLPVATSRGPKLHASDPTTVNLSSGDLQLVEFFRFT